LSLLEKEDIEGEIGGEVLGRRGGSHGAKSKAATPKRARVKSAGWPDAFKFEI
jgi:hypothetical protein